LHHLTAGYKAVFSKITYEGIDTCRQACGGAGFSAHSGLPYLQVDYAPNTTYEGDNTVMLQQAARLIMKMWKHIHVKKSTTKVTQPLFGYFYEADSLNGAKSDIKTVDDLMCLDRLEKALKIRSLYKIKKTMEHLLKAEADGISEAERNNSLYSVDIVSMTQTHMLFIVYKLFRQWTESPNIKCSGIRKNV
jgi:acyl-CoA oxidase